jgi:CubicO group peptidase (beta-lactamase class C family)
MIDFSQVDQTLTTLCEKNEVPSATLCVYHKGKIIHEGAYGYPDPETGVPTTLETRYDMASLTKIFASTAFMTLVEEGVFSLDEKVCESFPEFTGMRNIVPMANELIPGETNNTSHGQSDAGEVTWYHVLTHTSGMGWISMYKRPVWRTPCMSCSPCPLPMPPVPPCFTQILALY